MAFNLETALRVVAKVQGLNEFKALTDNLTATGAASRDSKASLQQLSTESARLTQETTRASGGVRAQTTALQVLTAAQRQVGQETAKTAAAVKGQAVVVQGLTADAERLAQGSGKVIGGIKGQAAALQDLAGASRNSADALQNVQQESAQLSGAVSQLRSNAAGALDGLTGSVAKSARQIKDLQSSLQPTDAALSQLRDEVLQVGAASKQTERSLAQQAEALKTLRSQAEINGDVYNQLTADIERLSATAKGSAGAAREMAAGQDAAGKSINNGSKAIQAQVKELQNLQSNLRKGSTEYQNIGRQIDDLKAKAASLDLSKGLNIPGGIGSAATSGARNLLQLRRQLAQSMPGRVVLAGEGLATAGLAGGAAAGAGAALGGLASGMSQVQAGVDALANFVRMTPMVGEKMSGPIMQSADAIADFAGKIASTQAQLADLSAPFQAVTHAIQSIGPEAAAAAGVASLAFASIYSVAAPKIKALQNDLRIGYKGVSDEVQRMLEETSKIVVSPAFRKGALEELRQGGLQRLGEAAPGSAEARRAANTVAVAEREIAGIQAEQNRLLETARGYQSAFTDIMKSQVQVARDRLDLQRKLTAEVKAESAQRRITADQQRAERQIAGSVRRNQERLAREEARQERFRQRAAAAFAPSAVLALPAAGQTAFRGAVSAEGIGGGARRLGAYEVARTGQAIGAPMAGYSAEARAGLAQQADAANRTTGALAKLFMELDRVQKASNGSIGSLNQQRAAWDAIRLAVNPAAPAYETAKNAISKLDDEIKQLTQSPKQAGNAIADLFSRIEKLTAESNGSISSLQQQRAAWSELRNIVNPASSTFASASAKVEQLDGKLKELSGSVEKPRGALAGIFAEIKRLEGASNGSIGSLQRQRTAWEALRVAVNPAAPAYKTATDRIKELDAALKRLNGTQEQAARRGMGREALGGAAGALATGGGLQSAVGAAAGTLAFSGGPGGIAAGAALTLGAGLTTQSVASARELEAQSRRLRVMTDDSAALQSQIVALVREQNYLAGSTESTAAAYDVLQAGFTKTSDIISILKASTLGAVGGFTDITTVADAATSILNGYGLSASEAGRIVDQMKASTDDGKISMEEYAQQIGKVVPSAAAAKLSLDQINAAISALTAQGVPVETTFAGINQMIKTIIKPTKEAQELAKSLGLEFNAQALAAKGLGGFLEDVAKKTGKSSDSLSILFSDIDGYKAVVGLLNDDLSRFNKFQDNQTRAIGSSATAAEKAIDPLKRFDNAWKDLNATLGNLVLPGLTEVINQSSKAIGLMARLADTPLARAGLQVGQFAMTRMLPGSDLYMSMLDRNKLPAPGQALTAPAGGTIPALKSLLDLIGGQPGTTQRTAPTATPAGQRTQPAAARPAATQPQSAADKEKEDKQRADAEDRIANAREQLLERLSDLEQRMIQRRSQAERELADDRIKLEQQIADAAMASRRRAIEAAGGDVGVIDIQQRIIDINRTYQAAVLDAQRKYDEERKQTEKEIEDYKVNTAKEIGNVIESSAGRAAGVIARVGSTGQSTGPHLDARWVDGRPITAADADRYLRINGRAPSSFGVTSPYGPRQMFGRSFHAGVDIGAPSGAGISLQGGASLLRNLGFDPAAGNQLEIMTPQGRMRLLHLQPGAARPSGGGLQMPDLSAVAGQSASITAALGQRRDVAIQSAGVTAARDTADALAAQTAELDKQRNTGREQLEMMISMAALQRRGLSPAVAEARLNAQKLAQEESDRLIAAREQLAIQAAATNASALQVETARQGMTLIDERLSKQPEIIAQIEAETAALEVQRSALERNKQLTDGIASAIGSGMAEGMNLLFSGTENWGASLRKIASGVLESIAKQLIQILVIEQAISAIKGVLNALSPAPAAGPAVSASGAASIGAAAGSVQFANGGIFDATNTIKPFAMGAIVRNPTLFKYADGGAFQQGLMGEAGPEAIMPLRRLPNGRLGVEAMGSTTGASAPITVNVSVDATGSQVQGNAGQGQALGRAIAIAVRQELANQKRPGGLLAS
jgi:TP901 family phage tail tape measure protein